MVYKVDAYDVTGAKIGAFTHNSVGSCLRHGSAVVRERGTNSFGRDIIYSVIVMKVDDFMKFAKVYVVKD